MGEKSPKRGASRRFSGRNGQEEDSLDLSLKNIRDELGHGKHSKMSVSRPPSPNIDALAEEYEKPKRPRIPHKSPKAMRGSSAEGKKDQAKLKLYIYLRNGANLETERKKMSETSIKYFRETIKNNIKTNLSARSKERSLSPYLDRRVNQIENEADRSRNYSIKKYKVQAEMNQGEVDSRYETYNLTNSFIAPPIKAPFMFPANKRDPISQEINGRTDELYLSKLKIGEQKLSKLVERYQNNVEYTDQIKAKIVNKVESKVRKKIDNVVLQLPQFDERERATNDIHVLKKQYDEYLKYCEQKKDQKLLYIMKKNYVKIWKKFDIDSQYSLLSKEEGKT